MLLNDATHGVAKSNAVWTFTTVDDVDSSCKEAQRGEDFHRDESSPHHDDHIAFGLLLDAARVAKVVQGFDVAQISADYSVLCRDRDTGSAREKRIL